MTDSKQALLDAIECMNSSTKPAVFDVTIVCTTDDYQAEFWTKRLAEGVCHVADKDSQFPMVLAVSEDWSPAGAGNGLGTLYAFQKACKVAKELHDGVDIDALLQEGKISAALYHTAGKGTRLAPLPASENNNKPGVKLPFCHTLADGTKTPMTVLEAVVKQTGIYARSRLGRLSVFWGDQVFIPSAPFEYTPTHHVDIMCTLLGETAPTAEEWVAQGLDKYGVIAVSSAASRNAAQVEKVDHATAIKMLASLGDIGQVGPSLGSFSVSAQILKALMGEYASELEAKDGKFDTDPHFWMPLTLPESDYCDLMKQKGVDEVTSKAHHERMSKMKANFDLGTLGLFGAVDVGKDACWWDYGLLKLYSINNKKIIEQSENADLLRMFLGVTSKQMDSTVSEEVKVDDVSCLFSCQLSGSGSVSNSVLSCVQAKEVDINDAIVVNCVAKKIVAKSGAILYNLVSEDEIVAEEGAVMVSVTEEDGTQIPLNSNMSICGGKAWKEIVEGNTMSFEDMHTKNKDANVGKIAGVRAELFKKASSSFGH